MIQQGNRTASNVSAELADAQLDKVTGGGANSKGKGSDLPRESVSFNFTSVQYSYSSQ